MRCKVRQTAKETITIPNKFDQPWKLKPSIDHDMFSAPEMVPVAAGAAAQFTLLYSPVTMTPSEDRKHRCTVFCALPDGSAAVFNVVGTADAPDAAGAINMDVPSKQQTTIPLKVVNWLRQRSDWFWRWISPIRAQR